MLGLKLGFEFDTIVNSVNESSFDPNSFGCPPLVPPPRYSISGYVIDSASAAVIAGAVVRLTSLSQTATTDSRGIYTFDGAGIVGNTIFSVSVTAPGFTATSIDVRLETSSIPAGSSADVYLSAELPPDEYRIVLRWGAQPRDLDSHLLLSSADGGCEVYYQRRGCSVSGGVHATLDQDRVNGYGPETVTIFNAPTAKGDLTHFVYIYAGSPATFAGEASATLYGPSGVLSEMTVPSTSSTAGDRYWATWRLHADGLFDVVNRTLSAKPSPAR